MIVGSKPSEFQRRPYECPMIFDLGHVRDVTRGPFPSWVETAGVAATTAAVFPYVQGIASELGRRTAVRAVSGRLRFRGKGPRALVESAEIELHGDEATTTIVLTGEMSDDAKLALLDLDLESDKVKGKTMKWDSEAGSWTSVTPQASRRWFKRKSGKVR